MNFTWGTDLNEAMNDIRTRIDRVRNRLPEDADPPVVQKFDSNAQPDHGARRSKAPTARSIASRCASWPRTSLSPRLERVARRRGGHGRRRPAPPDSRRAVAREDHRASTCRSTASSTSSAPRTRTSRSARSISGDRSLLLRSQGQFENLDQIRDLVVLTKSGVPGLPEATSPTSVDSTEDIRSVLRINGTPGVRMQVTKQSGTNTVQIAAGRARGNRAHQPRSARRQDLAARRQRQVHRAVDRARSGTRDDRLGPGHPDHLPVPPQLPLDADRLHGDSDFGRRHVRAALLRRPDAQHDDVRRPGARRRHDRRRARSSCSRTRSGTWSITARTG